MKGKGGGHGGTGTAGTEGGGGAAGCGGGFDKSNGGGWGAGGADDVLWWPGAPCGEAPTDVVETLPGLLKTVIKYKNNVEHSRIYTLF